ncbi:MAG: ABC transporter ATP-binding protein [Acidobacteriota bacterium]|nr:ABC transporter ATP-binding protein [Acidobacteriota bacterium]
MSSSPILRIEDLWVRYGDTVAVAGAHLEVPERCLLALVGASGCGKTSLLRAIAGFEPLSSGRIEIEGRVVADDITWVPPERRRVGMVFQQGALFPHLTVQQNVLYGLSRREQARAQEVLQLVRLEHLAERFPDELSGGQQQRVALARALAPAPEMVLLDEPFANLDAALRQRLREEVRSILEAAGTTAVLVTHDQEEALSVADRVAVMADGRILQEGPPERIYHHPETLAVARFLGDGQLVPCTVSGGVVRSSFGTAFSDAPDGPGRLFVRPEDLLVMPAGHDQGLPGEVVRRRFFGHDLLSEIHLENGEHVHVRQLSSASSTTGTAVRVRLREKAFRVFPAD